MKRFKSDAETMSVGPLQVFECPNLCKEGTEEPVLRVRGRVREDISKQVKDLVSGLSPAQRNRLLAELLERLSRHELLRLAEQLHKPRRRRSS